MDVVLGRDRTQRSQVIKQADVVALLALLPEEFPGASGADNFRYYEPRCGHGSSLSPSMHGLVAARLGEPEMALRYFQQSAAIDLSDGHAGIDGGVHIAALGGNWMVAVLGFAGLSLQTDGISLRPETAGDLAQSRLRRSVARPQPQDQDRPGQAPSRSDARRGRADDAGGKRRAVQAPPRSNAAGIFRPASRGGIIRDTACVSLTMGSLRRTLFTGISHY